MDSTSTSGKWKVEDGLPLLHTFSVLVTPPFSHIPKIMQFEQIWKKAACRCLKCDNAQQSKIIFRVDEEAETGSDII